MRCCPGESSDSNKTEPRAGARVRSAFWQRLLLLVVGGLLGGGAVSFRGAVGPILVGSDRNVINTTATVGPALKKRKTSRNKSAAGKGKPTKSPSPIGRMKKC
jgi:hypothetical protein